MTKLVLFKIELMSACHMLTLKVTDCTATSLCACIQTIFSIVTMICRYCHTMCKVTRTFHTVQQMLSFCMFSSQSAGWSQTPKHSVCIPRHDWSCWGRQKSPALKMCIYHIVCNVGRRNTETCEHTCRLLPLQTHTQTLLTLLASHYLCSPIKQMLPFSSPLVSSPLLCSLCLDVPDWWVAGSFAARGQRWHILLSESPTAVSLL